MTGNQILDSVDLVARAIAVQVGGVSLSDMEWLQASELQPETVEKFRAAARVAIAVAAYSGVTLQ